MTRQDAIERLRRMTGGTAEPALTDDELGDHLDGAAVTDPDGVRPDEDGWVATWDLDRAASEVWLEKAGRVAGRFDFSTDGQSFRRDQVWQHCMRMADHYRTRIGSSVVGAAGGITSIRVRTDLTPPEVSAADAQVWEDWSPLVEYWRAHR